MTQVLPSILSTRSGLFGSSIHLSLAFCALMSIFVSQLVYRCFVCAASKSFSPSCPDPVRCVSGLWKFNDVQCLIAIFVPCRAQQCPCLQPVSSYMCPSLACYPGLYVPFLLSALCSLAPNIVHPSEYYAAAPYNKPCAHFPETTLVGCYCLQRFEQLVSSQVSVTPLLDAYHRSIVVMLTGCTQTGHLRWPERVPHCG